MAADKEIVDEIEKIMDKYTDFMYDPEQTANTDGKQSMSAFYMGMIMGTLARRTK